MSPAATTPARVRRRAGRALGPLALAAVLLVVLLASCSSGRLDQSATERTVRGAIGARIPWDVTAVRCPAHIPRGSGERVECRAVLADGAGTVRLRVTQADDDGGLEVELRDAVVDRAVAARRLHKALVEEYGRSFRTDCGSGPPAVLAPGRSLPCYARDDSGVRTVRARVVDPSGTLRFELP